MELAVLIPTAPFQDRFQNRHVKLGMAIWRHLGVQGTETS